MYNYLQCQLEVEKRRYQELYSKKLKEIIVVDDPCVSKNTAYLLDTEGWKHIKLVGLL